MAAQQLPVLAPRPRPPPAAALLAAVHQHDLDEQRLAAKLPQRLDVGADVTAQPPAPALLEDRPEGRVGGGAGHEGQGVVVHELGLFAEPAALPVEEGADLVKTVGYRLQLVADLLDGEVDVQLEVEPEEALVVSLVGHQLAVVPHLEKLLLLDVVEGVEEGVLGLLGDEAQALPQQPRRGQPQLLGDNMF